MKVCTIARAEELGALAPPIFDLHTRMLRPDNRLLRSLSRQPPDRISVPPPLVSSCVTPVHACMYRSDTTTDQTECMCTYTCIDDICHYDNHIRCLATSQIDQKSITTLVNNRLITRLISGSCLFLYIISV